MCQQLAARSTRWGILSGAENDVAADRIAVRANIARRLRSNCIVMNPDLGKVLAEALFHVATNAGIQCAPLTSQRRIETGRNRAAAGLPRGSGTDALDSRGHRTWP